jgi:acyl-CoA dehydrogenase
MKDVRSLLNPINDTFPAAADEPGPAILPQIFAADAPPNVYLRDADVRLLVGFFAGKGVAALKEEDRREQWYGDWIEYQKQHQIYARLLSPARYSSLGGKLDLLKLTRFLEVFGYFSPAHGYSIQVSFLGLFSILMGANEALKREAVAVLEAGGLLAFGVSEKDHGSDLLGNAFVAREVSPGKYVASGRKYYIGNSNAAAIISVLARKEDPLGSAKRAPFIFFSLRPGEAAGFGPARKIHTLGVRAGFVGEFEVKDHAFDAADTSSEGRDAWDAMFGTVALGKFLLGFGTIGICEHAYEEASAHLRQRRLYGKPAIHMPHLRSTMAQAYARLAAMKLYAYRTLDYVQCASSADRRYLLFTSVQKARVSTEGVKVMALLSECIGAKGFEADTYFEMALRDAQLFPSVEGSTHINLGQAARFIPRYFSRPDRSVANPPSLFGGHVEPEENPYLLEARTGGINSVAFGDALAAYRGFSSAPNVRIFGRQVRSFRYFLRAARASRVPLADEQISLSLGNFIATIAYAQLVAENARILGIAPPLLNCIFHLLVNDLSALVLTFASSPKLKGSAKLLIRHCLAIPKTTDAQWDSIGIETANHG